MSFLFRYPPGGHTFISTQDPSYRYEVLCGHCEYPIEAKDQRCPRCQLELEDCPVCREQTHKKARKLPRDPVTGELECPVCHTRKTPFGGLPVLEIDGSFCRNIYGCQAGGLLLRTEELAVLRPGSSRCPICRHEELTPLDIKIFVYLVSRCLFCYSVFGPLQSWQPAKWAREWEPSLRALSEVGAGDPGPCMLCGRKDTFHPKGETVKDKQGEEKRTGEDQVEVADGGDIDDFRTRRIPALHYLRVVEMGRALILEKNQDRAFDRLFKSWFEPGRTAEPEVTVSVGEVGRILLEGTLLKPIHRILRGRVDEMLKAWGQKLPDRVGENYPIAARDSKKNR